MHKGFVIAGERSGVGKTMITLALARACMNRGQSVQCFKAGPDFIDPGYHAAVTGRISRNLDGWMMDKQYCLSSFARHAGAADIAIVEGVMGLYDGYGSSDDGSTAQLAKWLNLPVILIVDGSSFARTAGAVALGMQQFDPALNIAGIIFNRVGSTSHFEMLKAAVREKAGIDVLGYIPRSNDWHTPGRHLGLVMASERDNLTESIQKLSLQIEETVTIDELVQGSKFKLQSDASIRISQSPFPIPHCNSVRIGVARDEAFCFCYQDNIELLEQAGAEIIYISPLHDEQLPAGMQGLYLPGGYPELYAAGLNKNNKMREAIFSFCTSEKPVYAECGGFLYLLQAITDQGGIRHAMTGLFPAEAKMLPRLHRLGYVEAEAKAACPFLAAGEKIRGHEFHYSAISSMPDSIMRTYSVFRRRDQAAFSEGYRIHNTLGSYMHLHFASNPDFAKDFVLKCKNKGG